MFYLNNSEMNRNLQPEIVEGEIGIIINYEPGKSHASNVLEGAIELIKSLDGLDKALLSSIDTHLEPVSILNDVQHSSLKLLLARAISSIPDDAIRGLEWKKWLGELLVKGKYELLKCMNKPGAIGDALDSLNYYDVPTELVGYKPPNVEVIEKALSKVGDARSTFGDQDVIIQTEYGDVSIPNTVESKQIDRQSSQSTTENDGVSTFTVKSPDLIGNAQWTLLFNGKTIRARIYDLDWVDSYHRREFAILPGDSLQCGYKEIITADSNGSAAESLISIIRVYEVIPPKSAHSSAG